MAKKKNSVMGRPRKEFDIKQFEKLCEYQCTEEEIAGFFDMTHDTLNARCKDYYGCTFSEIYAVKRQKGKISLRRIQFQQAQRSASMAIWLGKQYLGQRDSLEFHDDEALEKLDEVLNAVKTEAENAEVQPETE